VDLILPLLVISPLLAGPRRIGRYVI